MQNPNQGQKVGANGKSQRSKVKSNGSGKGKGKGRARRSPLLPRDARLLIRFLELLCPDDVKYVSGGRFTSRVQKAVIHALEPGSEENIVWSGFPGVWYVRSRSRGHKLNRWYIVDVSSLTCEVDVSQLQVPRGMTINEEDFYCEDHQRNNGLCWHLFAATLAEAGRLDHLQFPEEASQDD